MKWAELVEILDHHQAISPNQDAVIQKLSTNSRFAQEENKSLFLAIEGDQHDGHDFIEEMHLAGCRNFIVEKEIAVNSFIDSNFLIVGSSVKCLQQIATLHRQSFDVPVIGITGSNGKTTVKEWLSIILGQQQVITKSPKSYNSQIGVPLSIWQLSNRTEIGIFEAGISKDGEMERLERIIQPTIGIFTSLGQAHADGFTSTREKLMEKAKLFLNCNKLIYSSDNPMVAETLGTLYPKKSITWSKTDAVADYQYKVSSNSVKLLKENTAFSFSLPFDFEIWVDNALHVITAALELGYQMDDIQRGLQQLKPVEMRLQVKEGRNGTYIIDDTYNNDLQALEIALDFLRQQKQRSRKTVVISDLLQSGLPDEELYERVSELLRRHQVDRLIGVGEKIFNLPDFGGETEFFKTTMDLLRQPPSFQDEMILVKGARPFELERFVKILQFKNHRTELRINFEALRYNLNQYRSFVEKNTKIMAMVKAFAYGGGSHEIANFLQFHGVDYLGVAYVDEGIGLRDHGINLPIMVMNPDQENLSLIFEYRLEPEIYSVQLLKQLISMQKPVSIHLKIETGMNRLGLDEKELKQVLNLLAQNPEVRVVGVFTHLSSSEDHNQDEFTEQQVSLFEKRIELIEKSIGYIPIRHVLNSSGIVRWKNYHFDMVRMGIGLYGFDATRTLNLRPVSTLVSRISQIKEVEKGETVGYNRKGVIKQKSKVATIEIGYADGLIRALGNGKGKINVKGTLCPIIGNICMDMTMIDVTGVNCSEGEMVKIFGDKPTVEEVASWAGTIPYEILTNVKARVQRVYHSE